MLNCPAPASGCGTDARGPGPIRVGTPNIGSAAKIGAEATARRWHLNHRAVIHGQASFRCKGNTGVEYPPPSCCALCYRPSSRSRCCRASARDKARGSRGRPRGRERARKTGLKLLSICEASVRTTPRLQGGVKHVAGSG